MPIFPTVLTPNQKVNALSVVLQDNDYINSEDNLGLVYEKDSDLTSGIYPDFP